MVGLSHGHVRVGESRTIGQRLRSVSFTLFRQIYGTEYWGYNKAAFLPIVRDALAASPGLVVDAACGYRNAYLEDIDVEESIGIDLDDSVRAKNKHHSNFVFQDMHEKLELRDVAAIISVDTWEHLQEPEKVLGNFSKVRKEGGPLIIVAPQRYYFISLVTLVLPSAVQDLAWRLAKGRDRMPFPAYYRLCDRRALARAAAETGFDLVEYRAHDMASSWFLKVPPVFLLMCGWMSLVNRFAIFAPLRSSFVAVLRKRPTGG